jgi:HlyD family secretion protein
MNKVWLKRLGLGAVVLAILGGFYYAMRETPTLVDVATVSEGPMHIAIREEGTTRVRDVYTVSAPIAGHLARTVLEEGDEVEAGRTVVASIHPLDPPLIDRRTEAELVAARDAARAAVALAEIELQRAETALRLANNELERAVRLFEPRVISESALQRVQNDVEMQRAQVETARATIGVRQAELASAEARLMQPETRGAEGQDCCVNIYAPVDGVVLSVMAKSEQAVSTGTQIAEIGDPNRLEIVVDLLSADAIRVRPGARTSIVDWGGDDALPGVVRRVDPAGFTKVSALGIEEQRVNAVIDLEENGGRLGHGYRVAAELTIWECERCVQVPIGTLFRSGNNWNVFRVEGDRLRRTEVSIGRMNTEVAQVLDGLSPGDVVVMHPSDTVDDGSLVEARAQ